MKKSYLKPHAVRSNNHRNLLLDKVDRNHISNPNTNLYDNYKHTKHIPRSPAHSPYSHRLNSTPMRNHRSTSCHRERIRNNG